MTADVAVGEDDEAFVFCENCLKRGVVFAEDGIVGCATAKVVIWSTGEQVVVFLVGGVGEGDGVFELETAEVAPRLSVLNYTIGVGDLDGGEGPTVDFDAARDAR